MKTVTVKLYNSEYTPQLHDTVNIAGIIWNTAITILKDFYDETGALMAKSKLQTILKDMRNSPDNSHWRLVGSQAVQDITDRIYRSYKLFFSNRQKGLKASPPRRRKVKKYRSFTLKQAGYSFLPGAKVRIGNATFRYWDSYDGILETARIHTVTVKRNPLGEFFLHVVIDCNVTTLETGDGRGEIGMDFGLRTFLTLSDGERIKSPQFFREGINDIRKANRSLSRREIGSGGWVRASKALYRVHERIRNQRRDWFWKTAHDLCRKYRTIVIEDLNLKAMQRLWGRKVSDYAYGEFISILEHVARKYGTIIVKVDRFFPSSQTCSVCGHRNSEVKDLKVRQWTCPRCGEVHDRDVNASRSILKEGLKMIASASDGKAV